MIDSPPHPGGYEPPIIADTNAPVYTPCSRQSMTNRVNICRTCVNRTEEDIPKCALSQLDINLMISVNEQSCPGGFW